ncbi:protein FAR1-RELATED SEQUENCE 11-like [Silene latifolia]|uniref:protein FAR1-RELATED SEQUENCE 11-like n=1 Tax=Silene latifolia TaxID=37657 RepID=UPI003D774B44
MSNLISSDATDSPSARSNVIRFFDLNNEPEDEIRQFKKNEVVKLNEIEENIDRNSFEPFVGQCFLSEEEAYLFYENFARDNGFSIRRGRFETKNGKMVRRDFFCHREGFPRVKMVEPSKEQRNRPSTRCGCNAVMRITLTKSCDIFLEEWHVTQFNSHHNHQLLSATQVRFLPSYRSISKEDEQQLMMYKNAGLSVRQIIRVMELQKNVKYGDLPFLKKDVHNFFSRKRQENLGNDAMDLLEICKSAKTENPNFQFDFTIDNENMLENIFWSPAHCFDLYQDYGDSTGFDTTYRVNLYDMIFGIFIGIDNHGRTILFGCALLRKESKATFCWLMKTFVTLMKKPPLTIITDQDPWMSEAISIEMPFTKHAYCIWHITSKFSSWFTTLLRNQYSHWCSDFYRLYKLDNIDDFEQEWPLMIDLAVEDIGQTQLHHTMLDTYRGSSLHTSSPLEEQVYKVFISFSFKKFQEEFDRATQYTVCLDHTHVFIVRHYKQLRTQKHIVVWNCDNISCSCKLFEFWGILCRHILSVFIHKDRFDIPVRYLPLRWCRDEFHTRVIVPPLNQTVSDSEVLGSEIIDLGEDNHIHNPPVSKTKGRPKFRREIGGKEAAQKQNNEEIGGEGVTVPNASRGGEARQNSPIEGNPGGREGDAAHDEGNFIYINLGMREAGKNKIPFETVKSLFKVKFESEPTSLAFRSVHGVENFSSNDIVSISSPFRDRATLVGGDNLVHQRPQPIDNDFGNNFISGVA